MKIKDYKLPTPEMFNCSDSDATCSVLNSKQFRDANMKLPVILGVDEQNEPIVDDLASKSNLLVVGNVPSSLWNVTIPLLFKKHPDELKFVMMDSSLSEPMILDSVGDAYFAILPGEEGHIISSKRSILRAFISLEEEMDLRYQKILSSECFNLEEYNSKHQEAKMPYLVVMLDEFANVKQTYGKKFDKPVLHLAQMGRGVGIHLVLSTNHYDDKTIDGFYRANFSHLHSLHCLFDKRECAQTIEYVFAQQIESSPYFLPEVEDLVSYDPFFERAARASVELGRISTPDLQRRYSVGFHRATVIIDQLIAAGIVRKVDGVQYLAIVDGKELQEILNSLAAKNYITLKQHPTPIEQRLVLYNKTTPITEE